MQIFAKTILYYWTEGVANIYLPEERATVMACSRHLEAAGREGGDNSTTAELVLDRMRVGLQEKLEAREPLEIDSFFDSTRDRLEKK